MGEFSSLFPGGGGYPPRAWTLSLVFADSAMAFHGLAHWALSRGLLRMKHAYRRGRLARNRMAGLFGSGARMSGSLCIRDGVAIPPEDLSYNFSRSRGPGGQHVNKTETRVCLRFAMVDCRVLSEDVKGRLSERFPSRVTQSGDLVFCSERFRSRERNIKAARETLADAILAALDPPRPRKPTRPSRASRKRRLESKKQRSQIKEGRRKITP